MNDAVQDAWREFCLCPGEEAFSRFYERTGGSVYTICHRILRDPEEACDALQSVYCELLALAHARGDREPVADIDEQVRAIAAREAERRRKRRWRRRQHTSADFVLDSVEAGTPPPDEAVAQQEVRDRVTQLVSELPDQYRIPLVLSYFHDMTHDQIAEALDVPRRTISRRIAEGLELLETRMRKAGMADAVASLSVLLGAGALLQLPASLGAKAVYAHASTKLLTGVAGAGGAGAAGKLVLSGLAKAQTFIGIAVVLVAVTLGIVLSRKAPDPPSPAIARGSVSAGVTKPERREPTDGNSARADRRIPAAPAADPASRPHRSTGVSGRVVSLYDKQPLVDVTVTLAPRKTRRDRQDESPVATDITGPDGVFELPPAPEGRYTVAFRPREPWVAATRETVLQYGIGAELGDVALNRLGTIRGRVIHVPGERGMPDIEVVLDDIVSTKTRTARTGPGGEFEFTGLSEAVYMVRVDRNMFLNYYGARVRLAASDTVHVDIPFGSGALRGRLLRGGKPAVGAAFSMTAEGTEITRTVGANRDGTFEARDLAPGRWRIKAVLNAARSRAVALEETVVIPESGVVTKDLELPSGRLVGRIVDRNDRPVSGSLVVALTSKAETGDFVPVSLEQVSGADGSFVFEDVLPGTYRVFSAQADRSAEKAQTAEVPFAGDSKPVRVTMGYRTGGRLVSVAMDLTDGTPIRDAWCYLTGPAGTYDHGRQRNAKGVVEIEDLPTGVYEVEVSGWGYSKARHTVTITSGQTVTLNDVLHEAGAFRWGISAPDGSPLAGVQCRLFPFDSSSLDQTHEGITGTDGRWTVRGIVPGEYTATATAAGMTLAESVTIRARDLTEKWSVGNAQAAGFAP